MIQKIVPKLKVLCLLVLTAGFVSNANAGILLEPYLGYYTGKWEQGAADENFSGPGFGARVGYKHFMGVMFGLDYMTGKFEDKSNPKIDMTPSQLGVFVGYEFPILLRVYGVYNFMDKMEFKSSSSKVTPEGDGGIKLGVGFTFLPLLAINVEYAASTYDEKIATKVDTKTYGINVSIPFDL